MSGKANEYQVANKRVIAGYYYMVDENEVNELFRHLNETLGTVVVEPVEEGWCDDLIERIRKSENVEVVAV